MKKSVLAIAVSTALMAGSTQAAVEVYGKLHLSLDQTDNGNTYDGDTNDKAANAGTAAQSLYVSTNASTLGFKASEDLEGGLKAIGLLEVQIEADNPVKTVPFTEREVYGGLGGGFGTIRLGKIDTPTKLLGRKADFFGDQVGDSRNLTSRASNLGLVTNAPLHNISPYPVYTYNTTQRPNWELRASNALAYTSPTMAGITVAVLYNPDEGRKDSSIKDLTATFAGDVVGGKLVAGLGWSSHGKAWNNDEKAETLIRAAGSYAMGGFKVGMLYQKASNMEAVPTTPEVPATAASCTNPATTATCADTLVPSKKKIDAVTASSLDRTTWGLGGSFNIGAGTVKAQYYKAGESKGGTAAIPDGATMIAVGYDHNLSKNTKVYVAYAATKNDQSSDMTKGIPNKGGTYGAAGGGHDNNPNNVIAGQNGAAPNNGSDPQALSVGMIFVF